MPTETALTPEIILAVFEHQRQRRSEIEAALKAVRPKAYHISYSGLANNEMYVRAAIECRDWANDHRAKWKTEREGADFDALCNQVLADIAAYKADMYGTDVERMALAIIQIKHAEGTVTDRALRMADFSQEAIEQIHERAALLANEMSDGKPFEVEFVGAGNHVEAA